MNEDWRVHLRNALERVGVRQVQKTPVRRDRYSLDLSEDLLKILEQKKISQTSNNQFEMGEQSSQSNSNELKFTDFTVCTNSQNVHNESDISFEMLEKMCDKTASDPNSTLFKYLRREKNEKSSKMHQRLNANDTEMDKENEALKRLLNELDTGGLLKKKNNKENDIVEINSTVEVENIKLEYKECKKYFVEKDDISQIEDTEAPSQLWESCYFTTDSLMKTSPVKLVGMLRPSTIMEENNEEENSSKELSKSSFTTANKDFTSSYETACEAVALSDIDNRKESLGTQIAAKVYEFDNQKETQRKDSYKETLSDYSSTYENDIVTIKIDDDDDNIDEFKTSQKDIPQLKLEDTEQNDKENLSPLVVENDESKSFQFNDTLEQVEFMMKKGMELAASEQKSCDEYGSHSYLKNKDDKFSLAEPTMNISDHGNGKSLANKGKSPAKHSSVKCKPLTMCNRNLNTCDKSFTLNIKPIPKLEPFKKPVSAIPTSVNMRCKDHFQHVLSPIGTYMKNTKTTPLMANYKSNSSKLTNNGTFNTFRSLDFDSSTNQMNQNARDSKNLSVSKLTPRVIPKKAYISSYAKQIVDERCPVVIPGGSKVQKILENATLPAVFRHEGKIKGQSSTRIPTRIDNSLVDMSIISGDISVYTMKDVKKF